MVTFRIAELEGLVGDELGTGPWVEITQDRIDAFAAATDDRQWIHVDPARAASGPYGGTVAHGYLTLALLPFLAAATYRVDGAAARLNYGLERVRFPAAVRSGSRVRLRAVLLSAESGPRGVRAVIRNEIEVEGLDAPGCVADTVTLFVPGAED